MLSVGFPAWMGLAACASNGDRTDDFYAEDTSDGQSTEQVLAAKRMCATCVVRPECIGWSLAHESRHTFRSGIFGGLTPDERGIIAQAVDPIAMGLHVLDQQVSTGLVLQRSERWREQDDASSAEQRTAAR